MSIIPLIFKKPVFKNTEDIETAVLKLIYEQLNDINRYMDYATSETDGIDQWDFDQVSLLKDKLITVLAQIKVFKVINPTHKGIHDTEEHIAPLMDRMNICIEKCR